MVRSARWPRSLRPLCGRSAHRFNALRGHGCATDSMQSSAVPPLLSQRERGQGVRANPVPYSGLIRDISSALTRHPEPRSPPMNRTALPRLPCAASLIILAVGVLIYAFRRVSPSTHGAPPVPAPKPSASSVAPRPSRISLRPPSLPLPRLASVTSAPKPAANLPYERIPHLL